MLWIIATDPCTLKHVLWSIEHVAPPALEDSSETTNGLRHPYFLALEIIIKVMMFFNGIVTTLAF